MNKKIYKRVACCIATGMVMTLFGGKFTVAQAESNEVYVTTSKELITALRYAEPGDEIVVAPGEYTGALGTGSNGSGFGSAWFYSNVDGTAEKPIIVRCEDVNDKPVLRGSWQSATCMIITGDYWKICGLDITNAQKGMILDNSNHSVVKDCVVHGVQQEGIHLRDGSSNNLIENCKIYDTGMGQPGFGEGIYIGSDKGKWEEFVKECDDNIVRSCELGPNIAAEHIDIKEGTSRTVIEHCIMHGTGISGQNYADSFIDAKGNSSIIRYNQCYQESNDIILDAFQTHQQLEGWGIENTFLYNTVYSTNGNVNIVNGVNNAAALAYGNNAVPAGIEATGNVTIIDKEQADKIAGENNGEKVTDKPVEVVTGEPEKETTNNQDDTTTKVRVKINGYQISTSLGGYRTVYTVEDSSQEVKKAGMIYGISKYVSKDDMVVGTLNSKVSNYEATEAGKLDVSFEDSQYAQSYARTMIFLNPATSTYFNAEWYVRAYAQLKDGSYVYSDIKTFTIHNIAQYLYQNFCMNNEESHNYLYDNILSISNANCPKVEFAWNNSIVGADEIE